MLWSRNTGLSFVLWRLGAEEECRPPDRGLHLVRCQFAAGSGDWRRVAKRRRDPTARRTGGEAEFMLATADLPSRICDILYLGYPNPRCTSGRFPIAV